MKTLEIQVQGETYLWNGHTWTDERFLRPPSRVRHQLTGRLIRKLRRTPRERLDADLVLSAARVSLEEGHADDARKLAQRVLKLCPKDVRAATVLATAFRQLRLPRRAIQATTPFERRRNAELLSVRAAAFADISKWDSAHKLVRRALALEKDDVSAETLRVMARVMSARSREAA